MKRFILLLIIPFLSFGQDTILTGDVDCDGEITSEDASLILQFVTSIIEELPCQENMSGLTPEQLQDIISMIDEQIGGNAGQDISMIGPMYRYDECDENCFPNSLFIHPFENYQSANVTEHRLYFADAIKFCGQLEYGGYNDWFLPNIKQLTDYISEGNNVSVSNIIDCDNDICSWEFWTISGTFNAASVNYNFINGEHYLVGFGEGWSGNSYKKCFCVR